MSDPKSSEREDNNTDVLFLNLVGLAITYLVILLFCVQQVLNQPQEPSVESSVEMWLKAIVDAVSISTFTYSFTQTINNFAMDKARKVFKLNICVFVINIPYLIMYALWRANSLLVNIVLCFGTISLLVLPSLSILLMVKTQESGQANNHTMGTGGAIPKDTTPLKRQTPES